MQEGDLWINLATFFIWNCLGICLTAASVIIAWRLVGWSGSHKQIFIVIIYYNVAMSTIVAAFSLTAFGIFKVFIPEFYEIIFNTISKADFDFSEKLRNLVESYRGSMLRLMISVFVGQALLVAGFILQYVWLFIGWGAFREMNGRTKARSGWAYFITMLINIPATAVMFFVMAATTQ